jgi:hypothetical protein
LLQRLRRDVVLLHMPHDAPPPFAGQARRPGGKGDGGDWLTNWAAS